MDILFQNYHAHKDDTNPMIIDSPVQIEAYAKRCVELGHKVLSSVAHGWQGRYHVVYDIAKKHGLKFVFGTEAYWVKDRKESDSSNCHIIILARNEKGRQDINEILSIANEDGFYRQPRLDLELIFRLDPKDVFITSACVGFWKYDDVEDIILKMHDHFKDSFLLEVQYHNTPTQKAINKKILNLSKNFGINIIMGCDSHYISQNQELDRSDLLLSKGIRYEEEEGWFMDYPTGEEAFKRFQNQGILSDDEILVAIENTNKILEFEDIEFDKSLKLPSLFKDKTQEEKDAIYKRIILAEWKKYSESVPVELHDLYKKEIKKEVSVVINTKMSDYFLLDYYLVKKAKEKGGRITYTGRGSGSSYFTNTLLGFSNIDRVVSPITLYPERFISETRILKSGSAPDLDMNLGNPEIFQQAQDELLGEGHAYPMIAFGKLRPKSAFKMYARSQSLDVGIANSISRQIEDFENALKHAEEEEKEHLSIYDYIDDEYHSYIDASQHYLGIIADKKIHPCAYIVYTGDIRREIGLMRLTNKSSKKDVLVACIEGAVADKFGYLKNDFLKVDVVNIISNIYDRVGVKQHTINELSEIIKGDDKVWDIYARGLTACINQCESVGTTLKAMKYKPTSISELTAFIAGIRPSFKSMYKVFESRQPFSYGITAFDKLIQTEEMPYSFILYQEQMMKTLEYAGFPVSECYDIIKAIAKKHPELVIPLKQTFIDGFSKKIIETEPFLSMDKVTENCNKIWKIIEDSAGYGFNASHALAYAYDSVYCAYLKAYYPYEFYAEVLQTYSDKGDKGRVTKIAREMEQGFGISLGKYRFRQDNRQFTINRDLKEIQPSLLAIKNLNQKCSEDLYNIRDRVFPTFTDLLIALLEETSLNKTKINILIKLGYFEEFYKNKKLLDIYEHFQNRYKKGHTEKTKTARRLEMIEFENHIENKPLGIKDQLRNEIELLGYPITVLEKAPADKFVVCEYDDKYSTRQISVYCIKTGEITKAKCTKEDYLMNPFGLGSIMQISKFDKGKEHLYLRDYKMIA